MSSGFVPGGTIDQPTERDDAWLAAQQAIEATRRTRLKEGEQEGGKSLYEVLQQNKTAKQDQFEESIRLKNQFRSLDEDEVEFLDSVLESTRAKEEEVKRDTREQLEVFRKQREEADKALLIASGEVGAGEGQEEGEQWAMKRAKRKRAKEGETFKGVKLRKSSSTGDGATPLMEKVEGSPPVENRGQNSYTKGDQSRSKTKDIMPKIKDTSLKKSVEPVSTSKRAKPALALGLSDYSSDGDG